MNRYISAHQQALSLGSSTRRFTYSCRTSDIFLRQGPDRIGSVYRKILYREYTNAKFTRQVAPEPSLGMLGPTLRAETGDTIVVVFKNMAMSSNRSFSVHPHGVQYNKSAEGEKLGQLDGAVHSVQFAFWGCGDGGWGWGGGGGGQ